MDDAALNLRIRVITVSARAAVHSLGPTDPQVADVVARGRRLLDGLAPSLVRRTQRGDAGVVIHLRLPGCHRGFAELEEDPLSTFLHGRHPVGEATAEPHQVDRLEIPTFRCAEPGEAEQCLHFT